MADNDNAKTGRGELQWAHYCDDDEDDNDNRTKHDHDELVGLRIFFDHSILP